MQLIKNLSQIIDRYQLFILDIYGILHDGISLYPNVSSSLALLKAKKKKVVLLSNAPRRASKAKILLDNFGISDEYYDLLLTSGEYTYMYFKRLEEKGEIYRYFYIGAERDRDLLADTKHTEVADASLADLAIVTGPNTEQTVESLLPKLHEIATYHLLAYCINPDKFVYKQDGLNKYECAGSLVSHYKMMGEKVKYFGKPFPEIYEEILTHFQINKELVLSVGDGLETDILGANKMGFDSLLISSGMHRMELMTEIGQLPNLQDLQKLSDQYQALPTFVASIF